MRAPLSKVLWHPICLLALMLAALSALSAMGLLPLERVTQVAVYTLYGAGVSLLVSYTGLVPFGASVFFGCASYAAALFTLRAVSSELGGIVFALAFSAALAFLLGLLILRRQGLYFSLLTLAASQIAFEIAFKWTALTGGENGLQGVMRPLFENAWLFHAFVVLNVLTVSALLWRLVHSPFGRVLQAVRDNEQRAASIGYDTYRFKLAAFILTGVLVGWAGALQTYLLRGAYANSLGWQHAADPLLMSVLGGTQHFLGPLWGASVFILLEDRLSALTENWWLIFAPILIVFVLVAPNGLQGLFTRGGRRRSTLVRDRIPERPAIIEPLRFEDNEAIPGSALLQVRGISKRFGALVVAGGFDLDVRSHQLHSFIGPNGAGKTTFFHMLSGVVRPDAGTVTFLGRDITALPLHARVRLGLSRSFQIVSVFGQLTAFENVRVAVQARLGNSRSFWKDAHADDAVNARTWSLLDAFGLVDQAEERCDALPHGQRRLLEIAITVATDARLLLLDEPLAGLAEADRRTVSALIRRLARTHAVLLIEHDIDRVLGMSDRITVLHQGRLIADGTPAEVAAHPEVISAYLGTAHNAPRPRAATAAAALLRPPEGTPLLEVKGLRAGYSGGEVLAGIDLRIEAGEIVALLGRNGVGKTTLLHALMGTLKLSAGQVLLDGKSVGGLLPHEIQRAGLSIVPEGRRLFGNLSVLDNLRLAQRPGGAGLHEVYELFPKLRLVQGRRAEHLSGGERQMVAIARALMAPSRVILLDEPFEGLAPAVVQEVMAAIGKLRGRASIVLVEHHAQQVLSLADKAYVVVNGRIAYEGTAQALHADESLQASLLGIAQPVVSQVDKFAMSHD